MIQVNFFVQNNTNPGVYTVILTATNVGGSDAETKISYITINAQNLGSNRVYLPLIIK
jgi:PKD repeat protein